MYLVGIDLGGTEIKGGIFNEGGELLHKFSKKTPVKEGFEGICQALHQLILELLDRGNITKEELKAVGIGIPGLCNGEGLVYTAINLQWENVPLGKRLRELTGLEIHIENDATVAALGEAAIGSMKGAKNAVLVTLGTGVGGGIIINGRPYSGSHGLGSELGHMIVGENDYNCNCGSNGCLETFASATALVEYTKKLLKQGKQQSIIMDQVQHNLEKLDAKIIFDAAKEGDLIALMAMERFTKYLAMGIGNIITLLDPEVIAIGGGLSNAGDFLLHQLQQKLQSYIFYKKDKIKCRITLAELKNDAGIVGAAMLGGF